MNPLVIRRPVSSSPLQQFVDCFWIQSNYGQPHRRERVLPAGTADLVFALGSDGRARSSVAGPRSIVFELETSRPFSAIGIHFKPGGASPFFRMPIDELRNQSVTLDLVWGRFAAASADRLWSAVGPEQQFAVLQHALLETGRHRLMPQPAVRYAVDALERSRGPRSVTAVAERLGMSTRRFLDVFRSEVGLSPKAFCRIRRFAAVLRHLDRTVDPDWPDLALACGYFDQAHFNHDFRAFSGMNPSTYLRDRTSRTHVVTP